MTKSPSLILLSLLLASCAAAPVPTFAPSKALPGQPAAQAIAAVAPRVSVEHGEPAAQDPLAVYRRIGERGGLIKNFTGDIERAEVGYNVLVVPSSSQDKAEKVAHEWAPDARQIFVGYGYWKKPFISFVRHGYYSAKKDRALMLDFAVSKLALVHKSDEDGDNYRDAADALGDADDVYKYTAKLATEVAKANGYFPKKFHVGALLNLAFYGPQWVFLNDEDWTPELLVNAKTGDVTKTGPMMEAAKFLIKSSQRPSPSPTPTPENESSSPSPTPSPSTVASPTPTPSPSSYLPF
jgi:hypothetical protein